MKPEDKSKSQYRAGKQSETRRSTRRQTLAPITPLEKQPETEHALVTNLSSEGAFIKTKNKYDTGTRLQFKIELPTGGKGPIKVGGRVVRVDDEGVAVLFEQLHTRDLSRLKAYAGFHEMDDAVVSVQRKAGDAVSGNLLPVSDRELIEQRLQLAVDKQLQALLIDPQGLLEPTYVKIALDKGDLRILELPKPLPSKVKAIYLIVFDGPLHFMFEGLVVESGDKPLVLGPERMYHNERRSGPRRLVADTWMEIEAPHLDNGPLRFPVIDLSEGGVAVRAPRSSMIAEGMRFPPFRLSSDELSDYHEGATVKRITPISPEEFLIGLNFADESAERDSFAEIKDREIKPSIWTNLVRLSGMAKQKIGGLVRGKRAPARDAVQVARYKNDRGDQVVSLLNATFDLSEDPPDIDVAVIVAPAFLKRKEVFSLLARTLVDNLKRQGKHGIVLRFDATHTVGESEVDPKLEEQGTPYLRWTFSHLESDIRASMKHLQKRFAPKKRVVLTFSVAAMAARRLIADGSDPPVDLWISPFGCPDAQDMFQNYLAGIDLFQNYLRGEKAEPFLIYGRLADPNFVFPDSMKRNMAFLEQARKDMEKIDIPVTWIVGTYDYMVTRERVRQMLNAPGGGVREVFELASGHVLKTGNEAIESFKLISESISRHVFGQEMRAIEPDLAEAAKQADAEWARVKRDKLIEAEAFWDRHLFGTAGEREGYDVLLHNPEYVEFLEDQAKLMELEPGLRVADIGCGTGNFAACIAKSLNHKNDTTMICSDLVPAAVEMTRNKLANIDAEFGRLGGALNYDCRVLNLETARLNPLREFLDGRLYGLGALQGRIEGLHGGTIRRLCAVYNQRLHDIVCGATAELDEIRRLCPDLDPDEAETVLELSRASRFLKDETQPADLRDGADKAASALDLRLRHLHFGPANRECRLDLPDAAFDRIGASLVVPYLYDPQTVVDELLRALKPGGVVVLSTMKPNFDSSKSYLEEAQIIAKKHNLDDMERTRLLDSLREFASFVGCVMELEDEGRFTFFSAEQISSMVDKAGFQNIRVVESFGQPATAFVVQARKPK